MATISGGYKLKLKLAEMAHVVDNPAVLRVGFLENATYPNTPTKILRQQYNSRRQAGVTGAIKGPTGGKPVAMIAAIQEFGAPKRGIPPRPFFRNMIAKKSKEWPKAIMGLLQQNGYDAARALAVAGDAIAGQLRQSIIDTNAPPLAPSTVARKGFDKPLVDTGHMLNSVDWEVS